MNTKQRRVLSALLAWALALSLLPAALAAEDPVSVAIATGVRGAPTAEVEIP